MHKETEIRSVLQSILTTTGSDVRVYDTRIRNIPDTHLPAISIYSSGESVEKSKSEAMYVRSVNVTIVLYVKGLDRIQAEKTGDKSVDEKLDDLREYTEALLKNKYETLNKTVYRFNYDGMQAPAAEALGERGIKLVAFTNWIARWHDEMSN